MLNTMPGIQQALNIFSLLLLLPNASHLVYSFFCYALSPKILILFLHSQLQIFYINHFVFSQYLRSTNSFTFLVQYMPITLSSLINYHCSSLLIFPPLFYLHLYSHPYYNNTPEHLSYEPCSSWPLYFTQPPSSPYSLT